MDAPVINQKYAVTILVGCMVLATVAYLIFLYGSWVQFQADRYERDEKINMLLDRIPEKTVNDNASGRTNPGTDIAPVKAAEAQ